MIQPSINPIVLPVRAGPTKITASYSREFRQSIGSNIYAAVSLSHLTELPPPTGTRIYSATASDTFIRRGGLSRFAISLLISLADANMTTPLIYYRQPVYVMTFAI